MSDDPEAEPQERKSIWEPLDGSAPRLPSDPGPLSFTKPEPRPLTFPQTPPPAPVPTVDPRTGGAVFVLAGFGPRLGAYLLDGLIFGVLLLVLTVPAGIALGMSAEESLLFFTGNGELPSSVDQTLPLVIFGLQLLVQGSLPALFLGLWNGQTPGKRMLGLRVVTEDGSPLTLGRAFKRELLGKTLAMTVLAIVTLGIAFLANYLWPLRDDQNRAGHDFFAKTRVVTAPSQS